jgi:transcriptional regulator with XRE-family HTH domain
MQGRGSGKKIGKKDMDTAGTRQVRELAQAVGGIIAERRNRLGLSQSELAERVGINQESLSKMENGRISPKFERLQRFADALGCRVEDLFKFKPEQPLEQAVAIADMIQGLPDAEREVIVRMIGDMVSVLSHSDKDRNAV